jgi:hypothetical protein
MVVISGLVSAVPAWSASATYAELANDVVISFGLVTASVVSMWAWRRKYRIEDLAFFPLLF